MKITIFTIGSRGDVQPYAVLGKALAERGHDVILSTAKNFEGLIKEYNLKFHPVDIDYQEILNSGEGEKILKINPFAIQRNLDTIIYPLIQRSLTEFYQLAKNSDLVIYRPKTLADVFIRQSGCKAIIAAVIPAMEETKAFFNPMFSGFKLPCFMNKWSYKLNKWRYLLFKKPINQFQMQNGLEETVSVYSNDIPCIYGISPSFLERPKDWSDNHHLTGFWFSKKKNPLNEDLKQYLKSNKAPILITFGSMPIKKEIATMIISCISAFDERFLIVAGWGDWEIKELERENIKIINSAPYESLFPFVKAVVHHGGIGTTAECLRAGKPMFTCPVLYPVGDQYFWGSLAYQKGVAVKPIPVSKLTAETFTLGVKQLITDSNLYKNCKTIARKINAENGLDRAVEIIESIGEPQKEADLLLSTPLAS